MMHRHLGTIDRLPRELCDLVLKLAGETGKIKLQCAALLGQPRGICASSPEVIWAVFCSAWRENLEDCCLVLMLHHAAPMLTCDARYHELLYGFLEPFHHRFEESVNMHMRFSTSLFRNEQVMRTYFLTVDPNQRLPTPYTSTLAQMLKTSSAYSQQLDHKSIVCMCVKAYIHTLCMGWPNVQECVVALRSLYTDGLCDRVSLSTSLDAFILCIKETHNICILYTSRPV